MFILDVGKEARKRSLITGKKSIFWQHFFRKKKKKTWAIELQKN